MVSLPWVWMLGELVEEELWVMGADRWSSCVNCGEREGSLYIGFRALEKLLHLCFFFFLVRFKKVFFLLWFFLIMLTWKIVGVLKISVLYIYIYIDNNNNNNNNNNKVKTATTRPAFCFHSSHSEDQQKKALYSIYDTTLSNSQFPTPPTSKYFMVVLIYILHISKNIFFFFWEDKKYILYEYLYASFAVFLNKVVLFSVGLCYFFVGF